MTDTRSGVPPDGLTHLGLLYDSVDDLVETALPQLRNALRAGHGVSTMVEPGTAATLRDALGREAHEVAFETPGDLVGGHPDGFVRRLREIASPARRTLVLTQYSAFPMPRRGFAADEDAINLVLTDLPLTMVCACDRASDGMADTARRRHPHLVHGRVTECNPGYRAPDDRCPTRSTTWGGVHALRMLFRDTSDLVRIRQHVTSLAADVGMRGDDVSAAVFAVHEAAVLACDGVESARHPDPCLLDVWRGLDGLVVEVSGPHPDAGFVVDDGGPRLPRNRLRVPDPMRYVRTFADDVAALGAEDTRMIRLALRPR